MLVSIIENKFFNLYINKLHFGEEKSMKRILVKENLNTRISSLRKLLREGNRLAVDLKKRINFLRKSLREGERSETDLEALHDVQTQVDSLIEELISTKAILAGLAIGGDDVYADYNARVSRQRN
jgi:Mg2+ and Co2+ transporter CorA